MKRSRPSRRSRPSPAQESLVRLASQLGLSSCRMEDAFWETRLVAQIDQLLAAGEEELLDNALDQLYQDKDRGYEGLADMIESRAESLTQGDHDLLLIAVPVLAWSRFSIPSGSLPAEAMANLKVQLQAHTLATHARLALADFFFSPDHLPTGFADTAKLTARLAKAALHGKDLHIDPGQMPAAMSFLSDTRYLIGMIATPRGGPLFYWQESGASREEALRLWVAQGGEALRPLLPGCALEPLQPLAFYAACREADRQSRAYAIRASSAFLSTALDITPAQLRAVVAPFHDEQLAEYRIGFTRRNESDVIHGVVWPLLEAEDENSDVPGQIETVLKEAGIGDVLVLDQLFPMEYCDDCGMPLYPNPEGEPVHAEMPEEQNETAPRHLH